MTSISSLPKLQKLSANNNQLGRPAAADNAKTGTVEAFATTLPKSLKTVLMSNNFLPTIPRSILDSSTPLKSLQKLDLSKNIIRSIPDNIANLVALNDLNLDDNQIQKLPEAFGKLTKLKTLSLRNNRISSLQPEQPLPKELWTNTLLIDLNLHGNPMTTTQLNTMDGYDEFLSRRREVKNKDILGGAMTDLEGCGLK